MPEVYIIDKGNVTPGSKVASMYCYTTQDQAWKALEALKADSTLYRIEVNSKDEQNAILTQLKYGDTVDLSKYKTVSSSRYNSTHNALFPNGALKSPPPPPPAAAELSLSAKIDKAVLGDGDAKMADELLRKHCRELSNTQVIAIILKNRKNDDFYSKINKYLESRRMTLFDIAKESWRNAAFPLLNTRAADLFTEKEMALLAAAYPQQFQTAGMSNKLMNQAGRYYTEVVLPRLQKTAPPPPAKENPVADAMNDPKVYKEITFDDAMNDHEKSIQYLEQNKVITDANADRVAQVIIEHTTMRGPSYLNAVKGLYEFALQNPRLAAKLLSNTEVVDTLTRLQLATITRQHCQAKAFQIAVEDGNFPEKAWPSTIIRGAFLSSDSKSIDRLFNTRAMQDLLQMEKIATVKRAQESGWEYTENPYEILRIQRDASPADIKEAYKALTKLFHPDKIVTVNASRVRKVTEAYKLLSDSEKKEKYDRQHDRQHRSQSTASKPQ
jgi:hypothetical protein